MTIRQRVIGVVGVLITSAMAHAEPQARIVFASAIDVSDEARNAIYPLACFDPTDGTTKRGAACLPLLPPRAFVFGARKARVRTGKAVELSCSSTIQGLVVDRSPPHIMEWPSATAKPAIEQRATATERRRLQQLLPRGKDLGDVRVTRFDVNGDGSPETFVSGVIGNRDKPDSYGLLALWRGDQLVVLEHAEQTSLRVEHFVDLEGDGGWELVISHGHWDAGGYGTVEKLADDKLVPLSDAEYCSAC